MNIFSDFTMQFRMALNQVTRGGELKAISSGVNTLQEIGRELDATGLVDQAIRAKRELMHDDTKEQQAKATSIEEAILRLYVADVKDQLSHLNLPSED